MDTFCRLQREDSKKEGKKGKFFSILSSGFSGPPRSPSEDKQIQKRSFMTLRFINQSDLYSPRLKREHQTTFTENKCGIYDFLEVALSIIMT